jgi:FtsH-binding integral membrane protein
LARTVPINFILLGILTVFESYILSHITSEYKPQSVFEIFAMTAAGFIGLSVYACYSKTDFTIYLGVLFGMSFVLLAAMLLSIFIQSKPLMMLFAAFGACFSMIFIVVDT